MVNDTDIVPINDDVIKQPLKFFMGKTEGKNDKTHINFSKKTYISHNISDITVPQKPLTSNTIH